MRSASAFAVVLAFLVLPGCDDRQAKLEAPPPREVSDASTGRYCGMLLSEHGGPKGQIFVKGVKDPFWFSSVRDAFAFTKLPEEPKDIAAIYVNDMARAKNWEQPEPGTWIDARTAVYVIGSGRKGGMGGEEAIPFGDESAATNFAARHGGRTVRFAEMPTAYIFPDGEAPPAYPQTSETPSEAASHGTAPESASHAHDGHSAAAPGHGHK